MGGKGTAEKSGRPIVLSSNELDRELFLYVGIVDPTLRIIWERAIDFSAKRTQFAFDAQASSNVPGTVQMLRVIIMIFY